MCHLQNIAILNFLDKQDENGRIPINVSPEKRESLFNLSEKHNNVHKLDDFVIGVDNDPCVFYRPKNST